MGYTGRCSTTQGSGEVCKTAEPLWKQGVWSQDQCDRAFIHNLQSVQEVSRHNAIYSPHHNAEQSQSTECKDAKFDGETLGLPMTPQGFYTRGVGTAYEAARVYPWLRQAGAC